MVRVRATPTGRDTCVDMRSQGGAALALGYFKRFLTGRLAVAGPLRGRRAPVAVTGTVHAIVLYSTTVRQGGGQGVGYTQLSACNAGRSAGDQEISPAGERLAGTNRTPCA